MEGRNTAMRERMRGGGQELCHERKREGGGQELCHERKREEWRAEIWMLEVERE